MNFKSAVHAELPFLRRYSRTLMGSQATGDALVRETLEALIEAPDEFRQGPPVRQELYRWFSQIWRSSVLRPIDMPGGVVAALPMERRQALLLTTVEGFSPSEAAFILGIDEVEVVAQVRAARDAVNTMLSSSILIIEDEPIIALHLKSIMTGLGHDVCAIVRTRDEAVREAQSAQPDLILADISLADGSSGIDAVTDILADHSAPVIYITAFPERLLTGERREPTYLITKPFEPETVAATVWQALLVHRERAAQASAAA